MVTTVTSYLDSRNRALPGEGYDGVVRVSVGAYYGTGALLYDGMAVLTAAHLFGHGSTAASVHFETAAGRQTVAAARVELPPAYDAVNSNDDLALVWLSGTAPLGAERYDLYRDSDEVGRTLTLVGYGRPGSGALGMLDAYDGEPLRLRADNQFDADVGTVSLNLASVMGWSPAPGTQLVADFDDGTSTHDAFGRLIGRPGLGLGLSEGLIASGDSGGPAFIGNRLAGVASYTSALSTSAARPDLDGFMNSSFGEIGFWQRVSHYQQWIDQSLRAQYPDAPATPAQVQGRVAEGDAGTALAYFMLQFTGVRSDPAQWLSVDFATRDGSALAGSDYLAASGTLILYPGETQAVIPVEIVGDALQEGDEYFYLDVSNPVGGSFGDGVVKLTAVRTIVDGDGLA